MTDGFQPGLQLIHGNRVEDLADLLAAWLVRYPPPPLEPALFLVQSNGMAHWLKLRLAQSDAWGIAANLDMQMPARFVWQAYRTVLGSEAVPEQGPFDKELLTWRLLRLLAGVDAESVFAPLARFLRDDGDLRKRHRLALQLADLFDQYQVYRADWLQAWGRGDDALFDARGERLPLPAAQRWQPALWRLLLEDLPPAQRELSRASVHFDFLDRLRSGARVTGLPRRVVVFGISSLPQQAVEALAALAGQIQVLLLVHNPCRYYWGDIVEGRELLRRFVPRHASKPGLADLTPPALLPQVNPLLASWGKQGRDYIAQLYGYDQSGAGIEQTDLFRDHLEGDIEPAPLLAQLQQGILDLEPAPAPPRLLAPQDRSVVFHLAHSRQREVEILHDQLLALLEQESASGAALLPRDVVVMVPDIACYAPHIEAVFGHFAAEDPRHIPYTIADRPARGVDPLLLALEQLLRLPDVRFTASEVLALLEVPAVRERAGIGADDLPLLRHWIEASGIRWGLDGDHRTRFELPPEPQNSWRFGLDRMLLGYAAGAEGPWQQIEPFAGPSGQAAALVGKLAAFVERLARQRRRLAEPLPPASWVAVLRELLDGFFQSGDSGELQDDARQQLLLERCEQVLEGWLAACEAARLTEALPLAVVRETLLAAFEDEGISQRFLAGCVNFCTLMPMRAIPFPVVCLLGMNDGDYPRQRPPADFDLMAESYRPGDRSRRDDDRYLFLEALLSARRQLYVSYIGRDERDNSERTPSVLVAQLRDHLAAGWCFEGGDLLKQLTLQHPLQPFSQRYFQDDGDDRDPRLFSYAREWLPTVVPAPGALSPLEPSSEPIGLDDLAQLLRTPADHFFRRRLNIRLAVESRPAADDEPFALDALAFHQVKTELFEAARMAAPEAADAAFAEAARRLQGSGQLPPGAAAELVLDAAAAESRKALANWQRVLAAWPDEAPPQEIDLDLADGALLLQDWLGGLRRNGDQLALVEYRASQAWSGRGKLKYHYFTRLWVRYLAARAAGLPVVALLVTTDDVHPLNPREPAEARALLERLAGVWLEGLSRPLPVGLKIGCAWLELQGAEEELVKIYEGDSNQTGERDEVAALARCWPTLAELVAAGLPACAEALYQPLQAAVRLLEADDE